MDLLEFGLKNERSTSAVKRALAKGALAAARKQADLYDAYLEKHVQIPDDPEGDMEMLRKLKERIAESEA